MIGGIEKVRAELEIAALLGPVQRPHLAQRKIDIELARPTHNAVGRITKASCNAIVPDDRRRCQARRVDVVVHSLADRPAGRQVVHAATRRIARPIRGDAISAGGIAVRERQLLAILQDNHRGSIPPSDRVVQKSAPLRRAGEVVERG